LEACEPEGCALESCGREACGLTEEQQLALARKKAERLISVRERSEAELRARLARAGFDEPIIERVLSDALAIGLVDDARFARLYVASKKRSGWGRLRIEKALADFVIKLTDGLSDEDELSRARACLAKHRVRAKDERAAHYRYLLSKGYTSTIAYQALPTSTPAISRPTVVSSAREKPSLTDGI
jgi:regulatory protein